MVVNRDQPCQNHGKTWSIHGPGAGEAKASSQSGFGFDNVNPFHVIAGAQIKANIIAAARW